MGYLNARILTSLCYDSYPTAFANYYLVHMDIEQRIFYLNLTYMLQSLEANKDIFGFI